MLAPAMHSFSRPLRHAWIFGTAFVVGFSGAIMPGPMLAATFGGSISRGAWTGPRMVLGHALVEIVLVAILAFGRGTWLAHPRAFRVIALVGGLLILLMGADMLRQAGQASELMAGTGSVLLSNDIVAGVITSISNPYFFLWWATVGLAMIQDAQARGSNVAVFFSGHILSDVVWFTLVSVLVAKSRGLAQLPEGLFAGVFAVCGVALIALSLWFVWSGFRSRAKADQVSI